MAKTKKKAKASKAKKLTAKTVPKAKGKPR